MSHRHGNCIHHTAIIDPSVQMGEGNHIGPYTVIHRGVTIGNNNRFEGQCSIGSPAEHSQYFVPDDAERLTVIENGCVIREFTTINAPTTGITKMGDKSIMLRGSHLSHDSVLEPHVTLSCNVLIGGHSYVMKGANIGLGAVLHQRTLVGAYAMIGMNSTVTKSCRVLPGKIYAGSPARYLKENSIGLARAGVVSFVQLNDRYNKMLAEMQ